MAAARHAGKLYPVFTATPVTCCRRESAPRALKGSSMVGLAIAMFIALFGWGSSYFGWQDPDGKVQLALATSFILGIIGGYRARS
jgi:hypothetical protein